jgi:hypothetical protein
MWYARGQAQVQIMRVLMAFLLAFFALAAPSAVMAQSPRIEFDIYDKSDFDALLKKGQPVVVHVNTTW